MRIGMVGLGKMGGNMTQRLLKGGHEVVVTDLNPQFVQNCVDMGAIGANDLVDMIQNLPSPCVVWVMIPAGDPTENIILQLADLMSVGDIIIDGGNSNYKDSVRRGHMLQARQIHFVDVGTSGGVWGLENGYSLMIGGDESVVESLRPIFETLAPAPNLGWGRVGAVGSGHFVKMIHNGIEYGMMQAFAEGFAIMQAKTDFDLNMGEIAQIWQYGSVVRSWLLDLIADALVQDQILEDIAAFVPDSGEGRWTVFEAIDLNVSAPIITLALERRIRSRENAPYADKLLSVMRNQFGGHSIKKQD
ncbi:MAG: decarboxylating 6-phosphogluconate dehydrogenase [Anaerolineae bacterium]|jgi:6-phosphogluconate dehydrogenase|nr:decarboxylating 6-phosphogluconate dehydrogenase [Anaerolineae bacterium]